MVPLSQFFSASILLSLLTCVVAGPTYPRPYGKDEASDLEELQRLLDQVDPPSLHAALHDFSPKKFKHGMFPEDRTAVEVIHRDNAPLATTIVSIAKRQTPDVSNGTAPSASTTTTQGLGPIVTPVPLNPGSSSSDSSSSPSAATDGSSSAPGSPSSVTSNPAQGSSSAAPSSISAGSSSAPSSLSAGAVVTTTNAAGVTVVSTLSAGSVVTTVNAAGVTVVSTIGGGSRTMSGSGSSSSAGASTTKAVQSSHTSLVVQTTTLPNGQKSTVTAVTLITAGGDTGATPSGTAGVGSASGTASSSPGLQTAMAARTGGMKVEILCVVGGAVGMAMLM